MSEYFDQENFLTILDTGDQDAVDKYFIDKMHYNLLLQQIEFMIDHGANPRYNNDKPFVLSCANIDINVPRYFINNWNVDINAHDGEAMMNAMYEERLATIKLLLDCNITLTDGVITTSVELRLLDTIELFINYSVDPQHIGKLYMEKMLENRYTKPFSQVISRLSKNNVDFNEIFRQICKDDKD